MKALILNSGLGSRMGVLTSEHPKCMTEISARETILSRQLKMLAEAGITEVVMTTGAFDSVLVRASICRCRSLLSRTLCMTKQIISTPSTVPASTSKTRILF